MNTRLLSWLYKLLIAGTTIAVLMLHAWIETIDATTASQGIVLNQVGYLPSAAKIALIRNAEAPAEAVAQLINTADDSVALTLEPSALAIDSSSGDGLQQLDFSGVRRSGSYRWQYGDLESVPFTIATNPYTEATRLL